VLVSQKEFLEEDLGKAGEIQIGETQTGESRPCALMGESLGDLTRTGNRHQLDSAPIAVGQKMMEMVLIR
jgi:hypothetical protein